MAWWVAGAISAAWCLLVLQEAVAAPPVGPRAAVESAIVRVLALARDGEGTRDGEGDGRATAARWGEIRKIARETFDFDAISRRALSRHWQALTAEEQVEFVALFRDLLERSCVAQIESSEGDKIIFTGELVSGDLATVRSKVVTRRGTELALDFRTHVRDGRWQVYDVLIGGSSVISSYRSQFDRVIRTESYRALRDRLQQKSRETAVAGRRAQALADSVAR